MKAKPNPKVTVSTRALIARINRKLAYEAKKLLRSRSVRMQNEVGAYYILDLMQNFISQRNVDLEPLAKELGVLKPYERLEET